MDHSASAFKDILKTNALFYRLLDFIIIQWNCLEIFNSYFLGHFKERVVQFGTYHETKQKQFTDVICHIPNKFGSCVFLYPLSLKLVFLAVLLCKGYVISSIVLYC